MNVLVYAARDDAPEYLEYREWLDTIINSEEAFGVSELVLSSFVRVMTNPRIATEPAPVMFALDFADRLRNQPNAVIVSPGERHWDIFTRLCHDSGARGNLVADAYLAALAIESGSEWITTDRDFARFPGLRWRHPLAAA